MQINKISFYTNIIFGRKLTSDEQRDYNKNAIRPALKYLGTEEVSMILHGSAFPETKNDVGVGSPYGKAAEKIIPFNILHGFNSIQLGPTGELRSVIKISPYESSVKSKNYLFIDVQKLTEPEYGCILEEETIKKATNFPKRSGHNYSYSDFPEGYANNVYLLNTAYKNYKNKLRNNDPKILELHKEYKSYMKHNDIWKSGLFDVLKNMYGTDDYSKWKKVDANLISGLKNKDPEASERYIKLMQRSKKDVDRYCFKQFILDKQIKDNTEWRKGKKFKYISDMLVGFSPADEWANQDLFLKGYSLGCPYGGPDNGIQRWGVPVLNPKKLFNEDGSLGASGKFLKDKLEDALTNFENVRIDHALGLVDPFIYQNNGDRRGNISEMQDIDPDKNYRKILDEIILPTFEEHGIDKNEPVWEDLVSETPVFNRIYHDRHHLPGITQLEYRKAEENPNPKNWLLIGSHDSAPANEMIKKDWVRYNDAWNPMYLAGVLNAAHPQRSKNYCEKIAGDDHERVKAKFAEMFMMGKKIQISFADFFGIEKTYNEGGNDKNSDNWKLRLNKDYENDYYENLSGENPTALNMPEVLKLAVQGKADMDRVKNIDSGYNDDDIKDIVDKLDKYEKILKE